jgi:hypothetical protein
MAERSLVERKLEVSRQLTDQLTSAGTPLLAAYWEWRHEKDRWIFYLVPKTTADERALVEKVSGIVVQQPYRSVFSLSDVSMDSHQIARARAIGAYLRSSEDFGRQFDTTFTGGHYFESVIVLYIAPELRKRHFAA